MFIPAGGTRKNYFCRCLEVKYPGSIPGPQRHAPASGPYSVNQYHDQVSRRHEGSRRFLRILGVRRVSVIYSHSLAFGSRYRISVNTPSARPQSRARFLNMFFSVTPWPNTSRISADQQFRDFLKAIDRHDRSSGVAAREIECFHVPAE